MAAGSAAAAGRSELAGAEPARAESIAVTISEDVQREGAGTPADGSQAERDFRFNAVVSVIDGAGYGSGISLFSMGTILPLFVSRLTASSVAIGLIPAVYWAGNFLPQMLTARAVAHLPRLRRVVMIIAFFERFFLALLAPLTLWLWNRPDALLVAFFLAWAGHAFSTGLNFVPYFGMIAKVFPPTRRGRVTGVTGAVGGVMGVACAALAERLLRGGGTAEGFASCFLVGSVILAVTVVPLGYIREPEGEPAAERPQAGPSQIIRLLRADPAFARFVSAQLAYALAAAAPAFYTVYAIKHLGATTADVARFTAVVTAAGVGANLLWGWVADHAGNRLVVLLGALAAGSAALLALAAPTLGAFYPVFALQAAAGTGIGIASWNLVMEFATPARAPAYIAVHSSCTMPVMALAPLLAGWAVETTGHRALFGAAALLAGAAFLGWLRTVEPRGRQ